MINNKSNKIFISIGILIFMLISIIISYNYYKTYYSDNTKFEDQSVIIYIKSGSELNSFKNQIVSILKDSTTFFNAAHKTEYLLNIKAGKYEIKKGYSNKEIINTLKFQNKPVKVTFNNLERIEDLALKISNLIEADSLSLMSSFNNINFLKQNDLNSESVFSIFLPDTYEFYWNTSADQFRDKMLSQFRSYWNESRIEKAKYLNLSPIEVSILASIVQRETPKVEERPTISGVYYNRLKKNMKLQADPTVVYTLKEKNGFNTKIRRVLYKDLKIKSPYNTYVYKGLPPGPICMPDFSSIESVLNLENHQFLFFVADVKRPGYHMFASTNKEHNRNKRQYTNWLKKNNIKR
ncbi:MAG: endolytic transglycosylase MltG [Flavobacteriaceae bacterium]|nr:endolytic transglycosylase MltG [Flavobacteriaceae bacterium]